jgi:hypothetical protein
VHLLKFKIVDLRKAVGYLKEELKEVNKAKAVLEAISDHHTTRVKRDRKITISKEPESTGKNRWPR